MTAESISEISQDLELHPLDDPVRGGLRGRHARFAEWVGRIARYDPEVAPFLGHPPELRSQDWDDLARLVGPGGQAGLRGYGHTPPDGWQVTERFGSVQMDGSAVRGDVDPDACVLGVEDVPEILDLIARTRPGPFLPRTVEMGAYYGIRVDGRLVAMAGERQQPPGWTEISAVCTDTAHRGQGLAGRLVRTVAAGVIARGEKPFLHALQSNSTAISLYESLGFVLRKRSEVTRVLAPSRQVHCGVENRTRGLPKRHGDD